MHGRATGYGYLPTGLLRLRQTNHKPASTQPHQVTPANAIVSVKRVLDLTTTTQHHSYRWRSPSLSLPGARGRSSRETMRPIEKVSPIESTIYGRSLVLPKNPARSTTPARPPWLLRMLRETMSMLKCFQGSGGLFHLLTYCQVRPPLVTHLGASLGTRDVHEGNPFD